MQRTFVQRDWCLSLTRRTPDSYTDNAMRSEYVCGVRRRQYRIAHICTFFFIFYWIKLLLLLNSCSPFSLSWALEQCRNGMRMSNIIIHFILSVQQVLHISNKIFLIFEPVGPVYHMLVGINLGKKRTSICTSVFSLTNFDGVMIK